jgi:hypothetical protein
MKKGGPMKRISLIILMVLLMIAPNSAYALPVQTICGWTEIILWIDGFGPIPIFIYICYDVVTVEAPMPPPDPVRPEPQQPPPPPPPPDTGGGVPPTLPTVSIVGYSTTIPSSPTINVEYNSAVAAMQLWVDGRQMATQYPPDSIFVLPPLDDFLGQGMHTVEVWATNSNDTYRSSTSCTVNKFVTSTLATSTFTLEYLIKLAADVDVPARSKFYRTLAGRLIKIDFSGAGAIEGPNNGWLKHISVEDAYDGEYSDLSYLGRSLATIDVTYTMTPANYGAVNVQLNGDQCDGLSLLNITPSTQPRCAIVGEYAAWGAGTGAAKIQDVEPAGLAPGSGAFFFGDRTLNVFP